MDRIYTDAILLQDDVRLIVVSRRCAALILLKSTQDKWIYPYAPTYHKNTELLEDDFICVAMSPFNKTIIAIKHLSNKIDNLSKLLEGWRDVINR